MFVSENPNPKGFDQSRIRPSAMTVPGVARGSAASPQIRPRARCLVFTAIHAINPPSTAHRAAAPAASPSDVQTAGPASVVPSRRKFESVRLETEKSPAISRKAVPATAKAGRTTATRRTSSTPPSTTPRHRPSRTTVGRDVLPVSTACRRDRSRSGSTTKAKSRHDRLLASAIPPRPLVSDSKIRVDRNSIWAGFPISAGAPKADAVARNTSRPPERIAGRIKGNATSLRIRHVPAPLMRAASSSEGSALSSADRTVRNTKG